MATLKEALTKLLENVEVLDNAGQERQQLEAQNKAAQAQLDALEKKISKLQSDLEKAQADYAQKVEYYKSERAKLMKTLDDRIEHMKATLANLEVQVTNKQSQASQVEAGLAALKARLG